MNRCRIIEERFLDYCSRMRNVTASQLCSDRVDISKSTFTSEMRSLVVGMKDALKRISH